MGKVSENSIRIKLTKTIKEQFGIIHWKGINTDIVDSIDNIQPTLSNDFKYEGSGEYEFSAHISFMVKENDNASDMHKETYAINPPCKMTIKESEMDFDIEIVSTIFLQRKY